MKNSSINKLFQEAEFNGVLMLKKSLFKLNKAAFLCEVSKVNPYFLKIIYYNSKFTKLFDIEGGDIVGNNYDFLFENTDTEYSRNHLQYIKLLKAVKSFQAVKIDIDIKRYNEINNYKIKFHPNNFKNDYSYCVLTFQKNQQAVKGDNIYKDYIEKSNLRFKKIERVLRNEMVLRIISEIIVSDIPLKQIADKIVKILCNHLKVNRCILYDYHHETTGFLSEYHDNNTKSIIKDKNDLTHIARYINLQNLLFKKLNQKEPSNTTLIYHNTLNHQGLVEISDILKEYNIQSQLSIIITFNSKVNGGLILNQNNKYNWSISEVKFLEIVAEQFSIAIDRSHSLDKVMEVNKELLEKTILLRKTLKEEKRMRIMQSEFVAMVSHEFKTPLQIIDGTREVISRKFKAIAPNNNSIDRFLEKIKHNITRLNNLIKGNLNLAKIETSQNSIKIKKEKICIKELINDIVDTNLNLAIKKNIKIISILDDGEINDFNGDRELLDHCFTNVISNAVKYSLENSEVVVSSKLKDGNIIVDVKDSGIGIDSKEIINIGKKFFRASNALTLSGTGIGLYLTKYFIELHNGSVLIKSRLNKGTTVSIILPNPIS